MQKKYSVLLYLVLIILFGTVYGFLDAVLSPLAGLLHPEEVPIRPILFGMLFSLSPVAMVLFFATGIIFPSLNTLVALILIVVHLYFIRSLGPEYSGNKKRIFEFLQVVLGPVPHVLHEIKERFS